jgi:hypothetical protein
LGWRQAEALIHAEEVAMAATERLDRSKTALIAYDVCRRALAPADAARRAAMRPVLDAWVRLLANARAAGLPVIYTSPVSRADGADIVLLPTDPHSGRGRGDAAAVRPCAGPGLQGDCIWIVAAFC